MTQKIKTPLELFDEFVSDSRMRLAEYIRKLPDSDYDGIRTGFFEVAFAVQDTDKTLSLIELRDGIREIATRDRRANMLEDALRHRAKPVQHAIESVCPTDTDEESRGYDSDYMRFRTDGFLFYAGQYNFNQRNKEPSLFFDWPIICIGRALTFAAAAAKLWVKEPEFLFACRFTGLSGRQLTDSRNRMFMYPGQHQCVSPAVTLKTVMLTTDSVENRLVDTLHELLIPLYEHFDYLQLSRNSVAHIFAPEEVTAN